MDQKAYGALVRAKRGAKKWTQENLAHEVFGDSTRKGDISRIENGRTAPQEATIQKINAALDITEAEMAPIRQSHLTAKDLDNIPALSRDDLELLATRFQIADAADLGVDPLREQLTEKAKDYRTLCKQFDELMAIAPRLASQHAAALDALDNLRFEEAEDILEKARELVNEQLREPLEINVKLMEAQATAALARGNAEQAYLLLCSAADSLAPLDPLEPARRRILGVHISFPILYNHGLRYGGEGLRLAAKLIVHVLSEALKSADDCLWAAGQNNLAVALANQGNRTSGKDGTLFLVDAVAAYRAALTVRTREDHPEDWALTQNNLGIALVDQSIRIGGEDGAHLLTEAVSAYRKALSVRTRAENPVDWAATQNNLGNALMEQGNLIGGGDDAQFFVEADAAYRAALTVRTRTDYPEEWAMTQNNLCAALKEQGIRASGEDGARLLAEAVESYRAVLTIRTRMEYPFDFAMTQNNLGNALRNFFKDSLGRADSSRLLAEAVEAYRAALIVFTRTNHPVGWATTMENMALTEEAISDQNSIADPRPHLEAALEHVEAALTVYDPEHMPYDHDRATALRDHLRARLDEASDV